MEEQPHFPERRCALRHRVALPVRFPGGTGTTRDVSAAGLYVVTQGPFEEGQPMWLKITLDKVDPGREPDLTCQGRICRVEDLGPGPGGDALVGVAVAAEALGFAGEWAADVGL